MVALHAVAAAEAAHHRRPHLLLAIPRGRAVGVRSAQVREARQLAARPQPIRLRPDRRKLSVAEVRATVDQHRPKVVGHHVRVGPEHKLGDPGAVAEGGGDEQIAVQSELGAAIAGKQPDVDDVVRPHDRDSAGGTQGRTRRPWREELDLVPISGPVLPRNAARDRPLVPCAGHGTEEMDQMKVHPECLSRRQLPWLGLKVARRAVDEPDVPE